MNENRGKKKRGRLSSFDRLEVYATTGTIYRTEMLPVMVWGTVEAHDKTDLVIVSV